MSATARARHAVGAGNAERRDARAGRREHVIRRGRDSSRRTSGSGRARSRRARAGSRSSSPRCPSDTSRSISIDGHAAGDALGELDLAPRSARRSSCRARAAARPPRAPPGARGRGGSRPTTRRSRRSGCRPRPRSRAPERGADEARLAADGAERAHRAVDAARDHLARARHEALGAPRLHVVSAPAPRAGRAVTRIAALVALRRASRPRRRARPRMAP